MYLGDLLARREVCREVLLFIAPCLVAGEVSGCQF